MTVQDPSLPASEAVVWLGTHGRVWAQVAFQFAHEFCHVIADPKTMPWDRFLWIEEAICEAASLFALRCMAKTWAVAPPYPNWQDYSVKLESMYPGGCPSRSTASLQECSSMLGWPITSLSWKRTRVGEKTTRSSRRSCFRSSRVTPLRGGPSATCTPGHARPRRHLPTSSKVGRSLVRGSIGMEPTRSANC